MAALSAGTITAISVGVSAASAAVGVQQSLDQARKQKQQAALQKQRQSIEMRQAEMQNQRAARDAYRRQRIAQGQIINSAATSGTTGSSGEQGALGSVAAQTGENVGALNSQVAAGRALGQVADSSLGLSTDIGRSNMIGGFARGLGQVAGGVFESTGGYKNLFSTTKAPSAPNTYLSAG